jgi:hypothetical protein
MPYIIMDRRELPIHSLKSNIGLYNNVVPARQEVRSLRLLQQWQSY